MDDQQTPPTSEPELRERPVAKRFRIKHLYLPLVALLIAGSFSLGFLFGSNYPKVLGRQTVKANLPIVPPDPFPDQPLRKYSIQNLQSYPFQVSEITLEKVLEKRPEFTAYLFSYKTLGKKMTGQMNIPNQAAEKELPVIVMIRGYVDVEEYHTGMGTAPVAAEFAKAGYVTVAPDFLGFGGSDPAGPGWEERFEKPVNVIELIKSIRLHNQLVFKDTTFKINPQQMGLWAHSNGGQISLSTLEALGESIPLAVWAPVTAPFPYSVLFYSDEMEDGGAAMRATVAGFESIYNVQEYSLTQYIDRLMGPIQLHQGTADEEVPKKWSDEFIKKIKQENERRVLAQEELTKKLAQAEAERKAAIAATASSLPSPILVAAASPSASPLAVGTPATSAGTLAIGSTSAASGAAIASGSTSLILADTQPSAGNLSDVSTSMKVENIFLKPIELNYFVYQGGNHFIRPGWEEAVARDLKFFDQYVRSR
ncbi:hypothetical protein H3C70_01885 [Patescibacteria group bacterium]|nr:hypothetical protein [Patescibacteria group bacterium]